MKGIPDKIFLQVHGADKIELTPEQLKAPFDTFAEITWCVDKIFDTDVEYRRVKKSGRASND